MRTTTEGLSALERIAALERALLGGTAPPQGQAPFQRLAWLDMQLGATSGTMFERLDTLEAALNARAEAQVIERISALERALLGEAAPPQGQTSFQRLAWLDMQLGATSGSMFERLDMLEGALGAGAQAFERIPVLERALLGDSAAPQGRAPFQRLAWLDMQLGVTSGTMFERLDTLEAALNARAEAQVIERISALERALLGEAAPPQGQTSFERLAWLDIQLGATSGSTFERLDMLENVATVQGIAAWRM